MGYDCRLLASCILLIPAYCLLLPAAAQTREAAEQQRGPAGQEEPAESEQSSEETQPHLTEEIVVVGTRAQPRTVTESVVPIDVISSQDIVSQGEPDVADQLRNVLPAYNVNPQPVGDAARIIRPATLRAWLPITRWSWSTESGAIAAPSSPGWGTESRTERKDPTFP